MLRIKTLFSDNAISAFLERASGGGLILGVGQGAGDACGGSLAGDSAGGIPVGAARRVLWRGDLGGVVS